MLDVQSNSAGLNNRVRRIARSLATSPGAYISSKAFKFIRPNTLRHTLQITSIGGVGTTFLYEFAKEAKLNIYRPFDGGPIVSDYGIWKHTKSPINLADARSPKIRFGYRVVYLLGDPRDALVSIYRRGFAKWAVDRLELSPDNHASALRCTTLDDYLECGKDLFEFGSHVHNWIEHPLEKSYPIMVIKYDALWKHQTELLDFMQVPSKDHHLFPRQKPRASNWRNLPEDQSNKIQMIYRELAEKIEALPDWFIR